MIYYPIYPTLVINYSPPFAYYNPCLPSVLEFIIYNSYFVFNLGNQLYYLYYNLI